MAGAILATTAMHVGDGVATLEVKHFKLVPGLDVVEMEWVSVSNSMSS